MISLLVPLLRLPSRRPSRQPRRSIAPVFPRTISSLPLTTLPRRLRRHRSNPTFLSAMRITDRVFRSRPNSIQTDLRLRALDQACLLPDLGARRSEKLIARLTIGNGVKKEEDPSIRRGASLAPAMLRRRRYQAVSHSASLPKAILPPPTYTPNGSKRSRRHPEEWMTPLPPVLRWSCCRVMARRERKRMKYPPRFPLFLCNPKAEPACLHLVLEAHLPIKGLKVLLLRQLSTPSSSSHSSSNSNSSSNSSNSSNITHLHTRHLIRTQRRRHRIIRCREFKHPLLLRHSSSLLEAAASTGRVGVVSLGVISVAVSKVRT